MASQPEILERFDADGRVWLRDAVPARDLEALKRLAALGDRPGARIDGADPLFAALPGAAFTERLAALWPGRRLVRALSFDKSASANWGVPWRQDRVIAVARREDVCGYSSWSRKSGAWHCEPPIALLQSMLFVRLHLDRSTAENGAMEIALGSHHAGRVPTERAADVAAACETELTLAEPGDVLVLAMLTLHRSRPARSTDGRRALRLDYGPTDLPHPLAWAV